ncbi:MAG TPA: hypothetical protein VFV50_00275 [Bdellovibrionales bacterium]|nr:hypothetical protein [Bdellovibrionales bacterium]
MDLAQFHEWYFANNPLLINLIFVIILALFALWRVFAFWGEEEPGKAAMASSLQAAATIDQLETAMKRILDSLPERTAAAALVKDDESRFAPPEMRAPAPEVTAAMEALKRDVGEKEKVIQELKTSLDKVSQSSGLTDDQKARISALERELQDAKARLAEYEIIEDDIANLSLYKSENSQLKAELEKLRRGKAMKKDDPDAVPQVSDIVAEFAAIVGAEDNAPTPVTPSNAAKVLGDKPVAAAPKAEEPAAPPLDVDPAKLIAEATTLPEAKGDDKPENEEDSKQKLINEFESFIKNG